ncbi:MAG: tRNA pseudouridine(55) synthase TruB [Ruminococcaceae bacterium]|nr:tRNA pseudouridine(55) synthase TruB [Oscillospiraceae bacterium]
MTDGVLLIHKPYGITSFDVVARVRRLYGTKKVGHTGTLDPIATGLLPVLVGRAVKASEFLTEKDKEYIAGLRLGLTTDTEDITGAVLSKSENIPDSEAVIRAAKTFTGEIMQIPPMYSALKVGGEKLVDLARKGIVIEREARPITIHELDIEGAGADYTMRVFCSKGTYIRTLCADIGNKLGCGGIMTSLVRTKTGGFRLSEAHTLEALEALTTEQRSKLLLPTETLFTHLPMVKLSDFFAKLSKNGCEIYQRKIGSNFPCGTMLRVCDKNGFYAIGEIRDYPEGSAVKLLKRFDIESK